MSTDTTTTTAAARRAARRARLGLSLRALQAETGNTVSYRTILRAESEDHEPNAATLAVIDDTLVRLERLRGIREAGIR